MSGFQKIKVDGIQYYIVDSIQNLRAEDSFIIPKNKLEETVGAGEARKYIGSYKDSKGERLSSFFEYNSWGNCKVKGKRVYPVVQNNCFFSKSNLLKYLYDSRIEYQKQEQVYRHDISKFYNKRLKKINNLKGSISTFSIYDVSDFLDHKYHRAYIRSDDDIWKIWRQIVLPRISYLSILKLIPVVSHENNTKPRFYFRVLLDYQFRSIVHPKLEDSTAIIVEAQKKQRKIKVRPPRVSQQKYRKNVIEHMPQCPFTKVSDERLLIASHIKPYQACINEDRVDEAIDYLNGLALTPTYDKLFDQGYITFTDKGELICGTQLTLYTWEKLNINPNAKNILRIYPEQREKYLAYHREKVFQDDIDDLV